MLLNSDIQLKNFTERALSSEVLGIDTEFIREKTYRSRLCLIQLSTDDEVAAVDPFAINDIEPLVSLFVDENITKVFHACSQDMEVLLDYCGVLPRPIFDTQIAYSYIGSRIQVGYGALVERFCGVVLPKLDAMTDWSRRPLDAEQVEYALNDVKYLPALWRAISHTLEIKGRTTWLLPEFEHASNPESYRRDPQQAYLHVKRSSSLTRRQLGIAQEIASWREVRACESDRPKRRILSDELVIEISKRAPCSVAQLRKIRGIDDVSAADQRAIVMCVRNGLDIASDELPMLIKQQRPTPEVESVCELMYTLVRMIAEREEISANVLASRDDLLGYLDDPASSVLSKGWRYELVGHFLEELLEGKMGLTVKNGRVELL